MRRWRVSSISPRVRFAPCESSLAAPAWQGIAGSRAALIEINNTGGAPARRLRHFVARSPGCVQRMREPRRGRVTRLREAPPGFSSRDRTTRLASACAEIPVSPQRRGGSGGRARFGRGPNVGSLGGAPSMRASAVASAVSSWRSRCAAASCGALSTSIVGVGAVVLDAPADVVEPERELGLRGLGAVDQRVARPDADHAAPGARADQRADAHQLEAVREDVAVRARVLVGERDHRAGDRLVGVRRRLAPALQVVADALAARPSPAAAATRGRRGCSARRRSARRGRTRWRSSGGTRRSPPTSCRAGGSSRRGRPSARCTHARLRSTHSR